MKSSSTEITFSATYIRQNFKTKNSLKNNENASTEERLQNTTSLEQWANPPSLFIDTLIFSIIHKHKPKLNFKWKQ